MNIQDKISLKLKKIWDEPEFYKNIFCLFNNEDEIAKLDEYLDSSDNITSDEVFVKVFEICKLDVYK